MGLLRRYNIAIQSLLLILTLSSLAFYNYVSQKRVFLEQLESDNAVLLNAVRSSINKFSAIKHTTSLQLLVKNISFGLEIFEFRYLDNQGIVVSSMFEEEIGDTVLRPSVQAALAQPEQFGMYYVDERDLTPVLAVSFPVRRSEQLVGIIDLAVDISELDFMSTETRAIVLQRLQVDLNNLCRAIAGSISSGLEIADTTDSGDFLHNLVATSGHVIGVDLLNSAGSVVASSHPQRVGEQSHSMNSASDTPLEYDGQQVFALHSPLIEGDNEGGGLRLYVDAAGYLANERQLFFTSVATSVLAILFSLAIAYAIYRINLERARRENLRLEQMVRERTAEIERISQTDKLTGLANRCHLDERMLLEFKRARRYRHPLSVIVVDLDHFKRINDNWGHLGGDEVLRQLGQRLQDKLRDTDFVGRFGGEEFVVILPETSLEDALKIAECLRGKVAEQGVDFLGEQIPVSASLGVATLSERQEGHEALFSEADMALYHVKKNGRNGVAYLHSGEVLIYQPGPADSAPLAGFAL